MQYLRTLRRPGSFTVHGLHPGALALVMAAVISGPSWRWRRLVISGIVSLVFLAGCGGGTASTANPTPNPPPAANPTPTITTISPNSAVAGGTAFTLTIIGTNFVAGSLVNFGGSAPATTFVNSTQLTAAIPAASIASTGTIAVTVTNPAPGGRTSNRASFSITSGLNTVPEISILFPSCAPAGEQFIDGVDNQLLVVSDKVENNFVAGSVVRWNGSDRPTTGSGAVNGLVAQISASDIASAGTATVTVFNPGPGGGSSNALTFTITPGAVDPQSIALDPAGKFAYVASGGCGGGSAGYVSMYTINPTTGALASIGPPVPVLDEYTDSVTVDPFGKFAYVSSSGDYWDTDFGSVVTYTINPTTGALTSTGGGISGTGTDSGYFDSVAVDPSGKFAYAADGGVSPTGGAFGALNSVSMYTINGTTGALTSIGTIATGTAPDSVAVDPAGKFAYVANFGSADVSMYTIDATTGALASIGTIAAGLGPVSVAVDPAGKFAYVANWTGYQAEGSVSMYTINATTGALTSIGTIAAGTSPISMAVDPAGKFAYVANFTGNQTEGSVSMYTINATTGDLTPIGTIATEQSPTSIAIHPSGKFAYVTNSGSNSVSMYSIDGASGTLTLIGTIGT
jgi:DNA-binding beta-propeller fold protein YncE